MNGLTKIESLEKEVSNLRVDLINANQQNIRLLELLRRAHPNMHTCETGQWFTDRDAALSAALQREAESWKSAHTIIRYSLESAKSDIQQLKQDRDHLDEQYRQFLPEKNRLQAEVESLRGELKSEQDCCASIKDSRRLVVQQRDQAHTALQKAKELILSVDEAEEYPTSTWYNMRNDALSAIKECGL